MAEPLHHTSREPELCHCCGRRAGGLATGPKGDRWLCVECYPLLEYVRDVRRWDAYEHKAVGAAIDAAGVVLDATGKTDLADMDEAEARQLIIAIVRGHQDGIRAALKEGPL